MFLFLQKLFQSTHSYRVRLRCAKRTVFKNKFQSTHSYRVRRLKAKDMRVEGIFQSTHSYRVRLGRCFAKHGYISYFNPLTRIEWDYNKDSKARYKYYFNPLTRIEWDMKAWWGRVLHGIFQSTHSYRVRQIFYEFSLIETVISIHSLV